MNVREGYNIVEPDQIQWMGGFVLIIAAVLSVTFVMLIALIVYTHWEDGSRGKR